MKKVKVVHMKSGLDLIGSKITLVSSKNMEITECDGKFEVYSKASNRTIGIPFENTKGWEYFPETPTEEKPKAPKK